jgi:hypothetical protein
VAIVLLTQYEMPVVGVLRASDYRMLVEMKKLKGIVCLNSTSK